MCGREEERSTVERIAGILKQADLSSLRGRGHDFPDRRTQVETSLRANDTRGSYGSTILALRAGKVETDRLNLYNQDGLAPPLRVELKSSATR